MSDFPSYQPSAQRGEYGIGLVSRIINDRYRWLFKRNHQEHDFGIDAQIEVINNRNQVTGQILSVQIKCGMTFFRERNRWGWKYRGERKHFNYLANYPLLVLIVICNPDTNECFWVQFSPSQVTETEEAWYITIPYENKLDSDQAKILNILPPVRDARKELSDYWIENRLILTSEYFLYVISKEEILQKDARKVRKFFDRLLVTKEIALHCQGKVEISMHGYDNDMRELFEIPEVREFAPVLDQALIEVFFFARTEAPAHFLRLLLLCQADAAWDGPRPTTGNKGKITFGGVDLGMFLYRHFPGLNQVTEWLGMTIKENEAISSKIAQHLGLYN